MYKQPRRLHSWPMSVYLSPTARKELKKEAARRGVSMSELVRVALDASLDVFKLEGLKNDN